MSATPGASRRTTSFPAPGGDKVTGILIRPADATALFVFAHGAGAGMRHAFMESAAAALALRGIATFRYNFPYTESGSRRPDPKPVLLATVRSAVQRASALGGDLPLFAGGKSMGGRMTSAAAAAEPLAGVAGIIFFGFPLHPAGEPSNERAEHLSSVTVPMLFLQGTRDSLADLSLLKPEIRKLGKRATLYIVDEADHSFHVPKRTGRSDADVLAEIADAASGWCRKNSPA